MTHRRSGWLRGVDRSLDSLSAHGATALPRNPALDVAESEQAYTVAHQLPGVTKNDVTVSIEGRRIIIEARASKTDERKDAGRVLVRERADPSCARSFVLPEEVDQERSTAKLDHGVLTLELVMRRDASAARITIN
jgi:HSP20 family protein